MNKKVLIITYYWPPAGGPGVQRLLKFAKYLPEFGWDPIILTVANGEYPAIDESLAKDIPEGCKVYKTKAFEPTTFYRKFTGMKQDEKIPVANLAQKNISWKKKLSNWVRLNFFVPDAKIGWIPYAVSQGKQIIKKEQPDIIFSSSPPPTVHLIAKKLAKWSGLKWVADFRDPWTDIYHYDGANRNPLTLKYDRNLEKKVLQKASKLTTVSKSVHDLLQRKTNVEIEVISNGFDEADFPIKVDSNPESFIITYAGKMNAQQNPENLWRVLSSLKDTETGFAKHLKIVLIGNIEEIVINQIRAYNLINHLETPGYVAHNKLPVYFNNSQVLLLVIPNTKKNKGIITGKMFEYLATSKFIFGIGPEHGDAAEILSKTNAGRMFDFENESGIRNEILNQYQCWKNKIKPKINQSEVMRYTRKELTSKLAESLEK